MNTHIIKHNLIENMLMLLSTAQEKNISTDLLLQSSDSFAYSSLLNQAVADSVYEIMNFMDEMPSGFLIYQANDDEKILFANKALLRIFQCDSLSEFQELTNNSFKNIVYHEDLDAVELSIAEQITHSQYDLDYVEYRIVRKDGSIRWVEDYGHFVNSKAAGDIFYVFINDATDKRAQHLKEKAALISEKEEKEAKIQNLIEEYDQERKLINQEHLRRLEVIEGLSVDYASILYIDLDADKVLPYRLSIRTRQLFEKEYKTLPFSQFATDYVNFWVHPEDRELILRITSPEYIRNKLIASKTYYINFRIMNEGRPQYLQLRIVNVGTGPNVSQIVMGFRNVDEEILREREHQQVLERALNNAKLANNAKNTFLSNMSHDMRTPMNAIFGYTALAKQHIQDSRIALGYINKIESSGSQLMELIEKVLEISWMESKDSKLSESECNLRDILQDLQQVLNPQAYDKDITLNMCSDDLKHADVYADKDKIRHFLLYLANNAIKYTKNGGEINITISEPEQLPNSYASYRFTVQDTGIGISREFLEHIFEPFEREQNTTFSGIYGTGLGLTIAKHIVEMMDGSIEAESIVGVGSTFTVTLRLRIQTAPALPETDPEQMLAQLGNQKILLVDDNEINLEIETEILKEFGFVIETATDGSIAVEKLKNSKPGEFALILMDIQMPVMDGRQATRVIRQLDNPALANIPIVALSANAFESDKNLSIESGMNNHLTKPVDVPLLLDTIASILQSYKQNNEPAN